MPIGIPKTLDRSPSHYKVNTFRGVSVALENIQNQIDSLNTMGGRGDQSYGTPVQDVAAIKAIAATDRTDKDIRLVEDKKAIYRFDLESSATDEGDLVLAPDAGAGRWIKTSRIQGRFIEEPVVVPGTGQTAFPLTGVYDGVGVVLVEVNGVLYRKGTHFTIVGGLMTWLDVLFTMDATKNVTIRYQSVAP